MKRRALSLALACALSLSLLSACGGKDNSSSSGSAASGSIESSASASDVSVPDASQPDASTPDASAPDASQPDSGSPSQSAPVLEKPTAAASLSLSKSDFTLKSAGATWKLKAAVTGVDKAELTWTSSDESVATVSDSGTVTAVAPGTATVTVQCGELTAQCVVRCRWEEQTVVEKPGSSSGSSSSTPAPSAKVDLAAFHDTLASTYEFSNFLELADGEMTDAFYPGLTDIATEQCLVYATMMSMNMGELVLVQVKDSKDVDAVKAILQTRIDNMANGGAWYPEPTRVWSECSKVVSNGNYIMMVVNDNYQSIVNDFNALF